MAAGCVAADEEAEELIAAAPDDDTLEGWIRRRERGEPLAWIIGTVQFCGQTLHVDPVSIWFAGSLLAPPVSCGPEAGC